MLRHYFSDVSGVLRASIKNRPNNEGFSTTQALPDVELAENEYLAMLDENGKVNMWPDKEDSGCTWQIKTRFEKVTAYSKETKEPKQFDDKTLVTYDYTLTKPPHQYVNWNEELDDWQVDTEAKYEAELQQVTDTRASLYVQMVDRLNNEAKMIRRVEGDEAKAMAYEEQANAAYLKIRADNPWPELPEA
ncbi:hypothetical protein VPPG_00058 [Vibrio phage VD1]|nr:hypothetical protein VPPG_00058 [Vibrio phage VD1]